HSMLCEPMVEGRAKGGLLDGERLLSLADGGKLHHMSCTSSFAEYAVIAESGCVPIDDAIPDTVAALVGCAVTTGFGAAVNDAGIKPGGSVAVWGVGGVGLNAVMGAVVQGAERVVAVDPNPRKEAVAKRFGATDYINPREVNDVPGALREMTGGRGVDAAIDCTGRLVALEQGWDSLRKAGTLVSVGIPHEGDVLKIEARMIPNSMRRLVGSYYGGGVPERDFRRIFDLYKRGRLDLDALVGETLPLEGINDAFRKLEAGYDTRMVVTFD
ncbi:MAG: zinc-binding dehydrogenase, partial [Rhodospirillaceae bacterium]|nr:zinc-binding dehydrogenase [Rhodospirillaceae bacterium]